MEDRIRISLGKTINLGNYESLRVDVELTEDINNPFVELAVAFSDLHQKVEDQLRSSIARATKEFGGKP